MPACKHHFAWSGKIPCTGMWRCTKCGQVEDPRTIDGHPKGRRIRMPKSRYIDWNKITPRMKVVLVGNYGSRHYEAAGRVVLFSGRDQRKAQEWLDARVKADARRS